MFTFLCGKIPGTVKEIVFHDETLTIQKAVQLGAEACGFVYNASDIIYLNGDIVAPGTLISNGDVVLVDIPKIKGAQSVIKIGRSNSILTRVALHDGDTVKTALEVAGMLAMSPNEFVYVNSEKSDLNKELFDGDVVVITKGLRSIGATETNINIYEALASLNKRFALLEAAISAS